MGDFLTYLSRDNAESIAVGHRQHFEAIQGSLKCLIQKPFLSKEDLLEQNATIFQNNTAEHEKTRATIIAAMSKNETAKVQDMMLNSLRFPEMRDRYQEISEAHVRTFKWIFDDSHGTAKRWSNLADWLQHGDGVYWINGKAGSGKSTLMRYIFNDPRNLHYVRTWSGYVELDTGAFFFWNSGSTEQRSHTGLLRSLLYEILKKKANLLPAIFPDEWTEDCSMLERSKLTGGKWELADRKWTLPPLKQAFTRLTTFDIIHSNQCFFIDGLDEYEGRPRRHDRVLEDGGEIIPCQILFIESPMVSV